MIRVVTFDLDNTLWDVTAVIAKAEDKLYGWLQSQGLLPENWSREYARNLRDEIAKHHPELIRFPSEFRKHWIARVISQAGIPQPQVGQLTEHAFGVFLAARHEVELFEDVVSTLERISQQYVVGALTNGNADVARTPLNRYFHFSFSAEELGSSKPEPPHFLAAQRHTGAMPREMLHVGDHLTDDIQGAKRAGWHCVWFNASNKLPDSHASQPLPDARIASFAELEGAIKTIEAHLKGEACAG